MKVALFNDSFPPLIDGVANTVTNYARYLTESGHNAVVVTPKYPNVVDDYPYLVYRYSSVKVKGKMPYRIGNCIEPKAIVDLRAMNPDILHVHCPFASAVLARTVSRASHHKAPMIFTYHTKFDIDINKYIRVPQVERMANNLVMSNIRAADEVWAVTDGAGKWLQQQGFRGEYVVMPNGTDFQKGRSSEAAIAKERAKLEIPDGKVLLFVGRTMWCKNIKLIVDSLRELRKTNIAFTAVFVGDGVDRAAIEDYVNRIGMMDHCRFVGAIYDRDLLRIYYSMADMLLFPSTYDTSGLVVKEAAACSCPSLLIRGSCAAECGRDDVSCVLAEETVESCAKRLYEVLSNPDHLRRISENAANDVYFSWKDAVDMAMARYEIVLTRFTCPNRKGKWFLINHR